MRARPGGRGKRRRHRLGTSTVHARRPSALVMPAVGKTGSSSGDDRAFCWLPLRGGSAAPIGCAGGWQSRAHHRHSAACRALALLGLRGPTCGPWATTGRGQGAGPPCSRGRRAHHRPAGRHRPAAVRGAGEKGRLAPPAGRYGRVEGSRDWRRRSKTAEGKAVPRDRRGGKRVLAMDRCSREGRRASKGDGDRA